MPLCFLQSHVYSYLQSIMENSNYAYLPVVTGIVFGLYYSLLYAGVIECEGFLTSVAVASSRKLESLAWLTDINRVINTTSYSLVVNTLTVLQRSHDTQQILSLPWSSATLCLL